MTFREFALLFDRWKEERKFRIRLAGGDPEEERPHLKANDPTTADMMAAWFQSMAKPVSENGEVVITGEDERPN